MKTEPRDRVNQIGELARQQQEGSGPVAVMYAVVRDLAELTREELQLGTPELRKLYTRGHDVPPAGWNLRGSGVPAR